MVNEQNDVMEKIISLSKQRGFVFQGSEIYGGLAGSYDYGPLGVMLRDNIVNSWKRKFVETRDDMYQVDASIIMSGKVWAASGHADGFVEILVEDTKTKKRYRADHLLEDAGIDPMGMDMEQLSTAIAENDIKSPDGNPLSEARLFNEMFQTQVGPVEDDTSVTFLRPETAQGIFVNFKNVVDTMRPRLPFGIAQVGKAFRNEITPRNFLFRVREFEQMEIEYFVYPREADKYFDYWHDEVNEWLQDIGLDMNRVHEYDTPQAELAHYSDRTLDFQFEFPFGRKELYGLANRTSYDLQKHAEKSKVKLDFLDPATNEKLYPYIIEPSVGVERVFLALLLSVYREDEVNGEVRSYLALPAHMAPYKVAVSPLLKNKPELVEKAQSVYRDLKNRFFNVAWDDHGNIGKRYRRQDEIGTPFCVVIDFDTLEDDCVTVRDRNTTEQERIPLEKLEEVITEKLA